jgi:hypothetical protein
MMVCTLYGAVTNTPGLGAANEALNSVFGQLNLPVPQIASAYACAYPLGVLGIIGATILVRYICRVKLEKEEAALEEQAGAKATQKPHHMHLEVTNNYLEGKTVLQVTPGAASYWDASGQNVQLVDFSELKTEGKYTIKVGGQALRQDLVVKENTFEDVYKAALKWFYYQRASMALEQQYAGQWARAAGHTNATAELHNSTGASGTIQSSKGWYDAGDYGRYTVNSGITTYTLLSLYEHFPEYFKTAKWNIPADGSLPDLLAEIKWNLDWMLTMQASDGGVYHKLTSLVFASDVMPAADNAQLYAIGKSTA